MLLRRIRWLWRVQGFPGVLFAIVSRFVPARAHCFSSYAAVLKSAKGLEIGGPSAVFSGSGLFPVYPLAGNLDNCNYSSRTVWEGSIKEGRTFVFDQNREPGNQFICEATDLSRVASESYDFILSSHVLEHTANPILALCEWKRVLKEGGLMVLIVPHKDGTFDHLRPITLFEHLLQDFRHNTKEDDQTHVDEVLALHDLETDLDAGSREAFVERTRKFVENRCIHHHVFNTPLVVRLVSHAGLQILGVEPIRPFHILVLAKKISPASQPQNNVYDSKAAAYRTSSPFPSDRMS